MYFNDDFHCNLIVEFTVNLRKTSNSEEVVFICVGAVAMRRLKEKKFRAAKESQDFWSNVL